MESPQMCPVPSCPISLANSPTPPEMAGGGASSHHVNWFILLSGILFFSIINFTANKILLPAQQVFMLIFDILLLISHKSVLIH